MTVDDSIGADLGSTPPGWYPDASAPGTLRWWDGSRWSSGPPPGLDPPRPRPTFRRGRRWPVWLSCSAGSFVIAIVLLAIGGVALDHTTGHFGRINVPGESYGLPDAGTYVISDGNYAAGMHQRPDFVVTGPDGESVPIETVPSHRYHNEDNALALFHVPHAGRYRLQVKADGNDLEQLPSTVTVNRSFDGTGDPLTGAWISVAIGAGLLAVSLGFGIAFIVAVVRRYVRR